MTTRKLDTSDVRNVAPVPHRLGGADVWATAVKILAASEALSWDDPAQPVLLARAQAYATLACAQVD